MKEWREQYRNVWWKINEKWKKKEKNEIQKLGKFYEEKLFKNEIEAL